MLAKALAHESGACFINLHISTLTEKWYGDSNKLVNAVFSLARKLQPAIVFIDEIDAVLGTRRTGEHEASGMVKAEYVPPSVHPFVPYTPHPQPFPPAIHRKANPPPKDS
jgi:ATP-dependent Zn protease